MPELRTHTQTYSQFSANQVSKSRRKSSSSRDLFYVSPFRQGETVKRPQVKIHLKKYRITVFKNNFCVVNFSVQILTGVSLSPIFRTICVWEAENGFKRNLWNEVSASNLNLNLIKKWHRERGRERETLWYCVSMDVCVCGEKQAET